MVEGESDIGRRRVEPMEKVEELGEEGTRLYASGMGTLGGHLEAG